MNMNQPIRGGINLKSGLINISSNFSVKESS